MQFKIITALAALGAALLAVPAMAQTVAYEGFASTVSCSGSAFGCSDGGAVCCTLPTGFGFSAQFNNLPSGSQGQGYTNNACTDFLFSVFGPGTKCWNGGGARAARANAGGHIGRAGGAGAEWRMGRGRGRDGGIDKREIGKEESNRSRGRGVPDPSRR